MIPKQDFHVWGLKHAVGQYNRCRQVAGIFFNKVDCTVIALSLDDGIPYWITKAEFNGHMSAVACKDPWDNKKDNCPITMKEFKRRCLKAYYSI